MSINNEKTAHLAIRINLQQDEVLTHSNRFLTLHYANNDRHKGALSSVKLMKQKKVKARMTRSKSRTALRRTRDEKRKKAKTLSTRNKTRTARSRTIEQKRMEQRKSENADDTKQITDGMKQNKRGNE
ncbi:hypothetical protein T10_4275, partial [Trichinella papuae]